MILSMQDLLSFEQIFNFSAINSDFAETPPRNKDKQKDKADDEDDRPGSDVGSSGDDDYERTYGDLEDGHDDLTPPNSDKGVDNLE